MTHKPRTKLFTLFFGDVCALYTALLITLIIRYGNGFLDEFVENHFVPFSLIFILWILVFYIAGLYDLPRLRNNLDFIKNLLLTLTITAGITIAVFYLIPYFGISPKTNLFLFIGIFAIIETWWRRAFNVRASFREGLVRVLLIGKGPIMEDIVQEIMRNPQIGYDIGFRYDIDAISHMPEQSHIQSLVHSYRINLIVVPDAIRDDAHFSKILYELLASGIETIDISTFYETVFRKIPIENIKESWFLEHRIGKGNFYDTLKRGLEVICAITLVIILAPIEIFIAISIKISSKGPVIYRQIRSGKYGAPFTLYKFRTMRMLSPDGSAEVNGPQWSSKRDARATHIGTFLRYTHLDEIPQLANIILGDLSFVGPRPERPEIVSRLIKHVPYYHMRLLVFPGITGWAQINHHKDETEKDVEEKLRYDIYYLKNRSLILDLAILIKTIKSIFVISS